MTPLQLARSYLWQQPGRTALAIGGVVAAVFLVFMQLGFLTAVLRTATLLYDALDFDLLLVSTEYISLAKPSTFSRSVLHRARAFPDAQAVRPITTMLAQWRDFRPNLDDPRGPRKRWTILVLAVDPARLAQNFRHPVGGVFASAEDLESASEDLARLGTVLIDRTSRREYGTRADWAPPTVNELNGRRVVLAGLVHIGTGFAYNGLLLTGEGTLSQVVGWPDDQVSFGLVQLRDGTNRLDARDELQRFLGTEVRVWTRDEINRAEQQFWLTKTAVGQFFAAGVLIALLVGGVFVYQIMKADIARRKAEYATIRALGYPDEYLSAVVYYQGGLLALLGYFLGLVLALLGTFLARWLSGIPIEITWMYIPLVFFLTVGMCMLSAVLAVRDVYKANPADLF